MPNKTRNANRKKQLKNKRKSRRQQKKIKCIIMCEKNTCKKSSFTPASCLAKNMDKSQKKVSVWKQVLINAEDVKKICHSINRL